MSTAPGDAPLELSSLADRLREAESAARRWRLVSRVAEGIAAATDTADFERRFLDGIGDELPVEYLCACFATDAHCPTEVRALVDSAANDEELRVLGSDAYFLPFVDDGRVDGGVMLRLARRDRDAGSDIDLLRLLVPHVRGAASRIRFLRTSAELAVARERLTALVVHDLKNPLSVVRMNLELLRETLTGNEAGILDDAVAATEQMLGMLLDLLDVSRAESGALPCKRVVADLATTVRESAAGMRVAIEKRSAALLLRVPERLDACHDPALIRRVLQNLLANATRFVPPHGGVVVDLRVQDDTAALSVSNNGPPIADDVLDHIFDKYGQLTAGQSYANRGLGLYLCRLVVERHEGTITAENLPKTGVCFTLRLPRVRPPDP